MRRLAALSWASWTWLKPVAPMTAGLRAAAARPAKRTAASGAEKSTSTSAWAQGFGEAFRPDEARALAAVHQGGDLEACVLGGQGRHAPAHAAGGSGHDEAQDLLHRRRTLYHSAPAARRELTRA